MSSAANRFYLTSRPLLSILGCILLLSSLGYGRATPPLEASLEQRSLEAIDVLSKRVSVTPQVSILPNAKDTWGTAIPQPAGETWEPKDIDNLAEQAYNSMPAARIAGQSIFLIAALWVPGEGVWMSSGPDLSYLDYIKKNAEQAAPDWWSEVQDRVHLKPPSKRIYHAEDGACFLYESSRASKLIPGDKYPRLGDQRSYISVYGQRTAGNIGWTTPCVEGNAIIDPACDIVLTELDVQKKK